MGTLWDLHGRLSALSITGREPALRQIRLAWWRDSLAQLHAHDSAPAEPLLQRIASDLLSVVPSVKLAELTELRIAMVGSEWDPETVANYGESLFAASHMFLGGEGDGGRIWALVDAALANPDGGQALALFRAARNQTFGEKSHRALKVLDRLARSIAKSDGKRSFAREQLVVLRAGLFGR